MKEEVQRRILKSSSPHFFCCSVPIFQSNIWVNGITTRHCTRDSRGGLWGWQSRTNSGWMEKRAHELTTVDHPGHFLSMAVAVALGTVDLGLVL